MARLWPLASAADSIDLEEHKSVRKVSGTVSRERGIIRFLLLLALSSGIKVFTNSATLVFETVVPSH